VVVTPFVTLCLLVFPAAQPTVKMIHKQLAPAVRPRFITCVKLTAMDGVLSQARYVARRLTKSVGKAAWLASTTLIVLLLPLVIEMDREQQLLEMEKDQMSVLTSPAKATS
jgi:import receptor subunit TOM22